MDPKIALKGRSDFARRLSAALLAASQPVGASTLARAYNLRTDGPPVTVHGVRKWLKGEAIPTQDKILVLSEWLNVNPAWLRFGEPVDVTNEAAPSGQKQLSNEHLTLIHDVKSLSEPAQVVIRDVIDSLLRVAAKGQDGLIATKPASRRRTL